MIRIPLLIYAGVGAVLFSTQIRLIFPGAEKQGQPTTVVQARPGEELVSLTTAHGDQVIALFGPALTPDGQPLPKAASSPTMLYFYGNAMCVNDALPEFDRFRRLGLNVMIPDYVGYGMSGGKPSESGCYATADAAFAHLLKRKDVDPGKIVIAGWSLGGAVAIDLASRERVAGLVALSSFTTMGEMARKATPVLPVSFLLRHRFDSLSKIRRVSCPILVGHGRRDTLVPYEMSDRLVAAARVPVMRFAIDDAGHNNLFAVGGEEVDRALTRFLEQVQPTE